MAGRAGYFTLTTVVQGEAMNLEPGWRPCLGRVTILAVRSKYPCMDCRLCVALHTFCGSTMVNTVFVTARALDLSVYPFQRKNLFVIKIHHPVNPIMAIQAGITKLIDVEAHELRPGIIAR
jgi:hypothetical protein